MNVTVNENKATTRIEYELPPFFPWGNWLSVRRQLKSTLDLSGCDGLELQIKVEKSAQATTLLRLTLSDLSNPVDIGKHGADETWWFDFEDDVLTQANSWQTIKAPFNKFTPSYGEGNRKNNYEKDLDKIIGTEINLISQSGEHPKGTILIKSFKPYKN
ncbi:MAG: CIA30 family protein [Cyanobacteria bacterium P01_F01_bin.143]